MNRQQQVIQLHPYLLTIVLVVSVFPYNALSMDVMPPSTKAIAATSLKGRGAQPLSDDSPENLYLRGVACEEGKDMPRDESKAAQFYRRAAEGHYAPAQYNLALLYEEGRGVAQDLTQAAKWYGAAAALGDGDAQNNLGRLYAFGNGVLEDAQKAAFWYAKAAAQGNSAGMNNLANLYREGKGVEQDLQKALELYQRAALNGFVVAQNNLGLMYANGSGADRNYVSAYAWLRLAARELPAAQVTLEQLRTKMTAADIQEAERRKDELRLQVALNEEGDVTK